MNQKDQEHREVWRNGFWQLNSHFHDVDDDDDDDNDDNDDDDEYGSVMEWYWKWKTDVPGEESIPVPFCSSQIPNGLARDRKLAPTVKGQRLSAWTMRGL